MKQSGIHESGPSQGRSRVPIPRRLIARLDIKGPNLVKGIHLEGLRVMGDPPSTPALLRRHRRALYIDIVASLYERNNLEDVVERTALRDLRAADRRRWHPTIEDVNKLLRAGADKVAINTARCAGPS